MMIKTFRIIKYLKILAAVTLLFSIFLPFNSCTRYYDESSFNNVPTQDRPPKVQMYSEDGMHVEKEYYKVKHTTYILTKNGWPFVFVFIWPFVIIILTKVSTKIRVITWSIESILAIVAAVYIFYGCFFGPEIGAYISFFSNILILALWILEAILLIYVKRKYTNLTTAFTHTGVTLPLHTGW